MRQTRHAQGMPEPGAWPPTGCSGVFWWLVFQFESSIHRPPEKRAIPSIMLQGTTKGSGKQESNLVHWSGPALQYHHGSHVLVALGPINPTIHSPNDVLSPVTTIPQAFPLPFLPTQFSSDPERPLQNERSGCDEEA